MVVTWHQNRSNSLAAKADWKNQATLAREHARDIRNVQPSTRAWTRCAPCSKRSGRPSKPSRPLAALQQQRTNAQHWYVLLGDATVTPPAATTSPPSPPRAPRSPGSSQSVRPCRAHQPPPAGRAFIAEVCLIPQGEQMRQSLSELVAELKRYPLFRATSMSSHRNGAANLSPRTSSSPNATSRSNSTSPKQPNPAPCPCPVPWSPTGSRAPRSGCPPAPSIPRGHEQEQPEQPPAMNLRTSTLQQLLGARRARARHRLSRGASVPSRDARPRWTHPTPPCASAWPRPPKPACPAPRRSPRSATASRSCAPPPTPSPPPCAKPSPASKHHRKSGPASTNPSNSSNS